MWRLDRTVVGSEIVDINAEIRSMAEHIIPLLEKTYQDTKQSEKRRAAAAGALIKADRLKAIEIFLPFILPNNDDEIIVRAVFDLGYAQGKSAYPPILRLIQSPKDRIRQAVANYLGEINMPKSVELLQQIKENDPSSEVRHTATYRLQLLGILPMQWTLTQRLWDMKKA
jgi:HEAT repeat protein